MPSRRLRIRAFMRDHDPRSGGDPKLVLGEVAADATTATFRLER